MKYSKLNFDEFNNFVKDYRDLDKTMCKYSYFIVKPNGNRHLQTYINNILSGGFKIFGFYAILNYEYVDLELHQTTKERKFVIPVDKMFRDCYGNYAILILIGKTEIEYDDFVKQVYQLKIESREETKFDYFSYVFNFSKLSNKMRKQRLVILDEKNNEITKSEMNENGDFFVFSINSLHAPDANIKQTIWELKKLCEMNLISDKNLIPDRMISLIIKYKTFEYLQDVKL